MLRYNPVARISLHSVIRVIEGYQPQRKLNEDEKELLNNIKDGLIVTLKFMRRERGDDEKYL